MQACIILLKRWLLAYSYWYLGPACVALLLWLISQLVLVFWRRRRSQSDTSTDPPYPPILSPGSWKKLAISTNQNRWNWSKEWTSNSSLSFFIHKINPIQMLLSRLSISRRDPAIESSTVGQPDQLSLAIPLLDRWRVDMPKACFKPCGKQGRQVKHQDYLIAVVWLQTRMKLITKKDMKRQINIGEAESWSAGVRPLPRRWYLQAWTWKACREGQLSVNTFSW